MGHLARASEKDDYGHFSNLDIGRNTTVVISHTFLTVKMIMITDRHLGLVIRTVWLINTLAEATLTEKIVRSYGWNGVLAYIAVDRQLIQEKLDFWHSSISQTCNGGFEITLSFNTTLLMESNWSEVMEEHHLCFSSFVSLILRYASISINLPLFLFCDFCG